MRKPRQWYREFGKWYIGVDLYPKHGRLLWVQVSRPHIFIDIPNFINPTCPACIEWATWWNPWEVEECWWCKDYEYISAWRWIHYQLATRFWKSRLGEKLTDLLIAYHEWKD